MCVPPRTHLDQHGSDMNKRQRTWIVLSKLPPGRRVKIDTYEYESLAKDILDDKISYNSMIEIFNDKIYWQWVSNKYIKLLLK